MPTVTFFPVTFFPTCALFLFPRYFFPTATLIESTELLLIFLIPVFLRAHSYFLSCCFFSYLPTVSFSPLLLSYCYPDSINGTITYFPNTVFLLAHCYFLSCYLFSYLPTFFPRYFFPTATLIESTELLLIFLIPVFLLAHSYFLSCYFFFLLAHCFFFPVTSFLLLPWLNQRNYNIFPNTRTLTCPLFLAFLLLFFLLAHCLFFSCHFIHTATQMNCYLFSCFFFSHLSSVTFFLLRFFLLVHCYFLSCYFFSCYFFSYLKLLLSFLLPFFLLLSFRAPWYLPPAGFGRWANKVTKGLPENFAGETFEVFICFKPNLACPPCGSVDGAH